MHMDVLLMCMSAHYICALCSWKPEESNRFPRTELQVIAGNYVGTRTPVLVLRKCSQCS